MVSTVNRSTTPSSAFSWIGTIGWVGQPVLLFFCLLTFISTDSWIHSTATKAFVMAKFSLIISSNSLFSIRLKNCSTLRPDLTCFPVLPASLVPCYFFVSLSFTSLYLKWDEIQEESESIFLSVSEPVLCIVICYIYTWKTYTHLCSVCIWVRLSAEN